MPVLPSGLMLATGLASVPERPEDFGYCPVGHFICYVPDIDSSVSLPLGPNQEYLEIPIAVPLPRREEDLFHYIKVYYLDFDGVVWWSGEWLSDFPAYIDLDEEDIRAWEAWKSSSAFTDILPIYREAITKQAQYIAGLGTLGYESEIWLRRSRTRRGDFVRISFADRLKWSRSYFLRKDLPVPEFLGLQDIHELAVESVKSALIQLGFTITNINLRLGDKPQIVASKEDHLGAFFVKGAFTPAYSTFSRPEYQDCISLAVTFGANPYMAMVTVIRRIGNNLQEKSLPIAGDAYDTNCFGIWRMDKGQLECLEAPGFTIGFPSRL